LIARLLSGPLGSRNFRLLVACDVTSTTGSAMAYVAVPFAVLRSGGSASDVGFVAAAVLVPAIIFVLFGGVLADRLPRQRVMFAANVAQALTQATFAVLVLSGRARLWEMVVLMALRGCALGFYFPAAQGLLPQTVPADQLTPANAIRRLGLNGAQIAGASLGGLVVGLVGPGWGLVADAGSYAVAAALRSGMRLGALPAVASSGVLRELREGWREFVSRRWMWTIVAQFALVNAVFFGAFNVLGPVVADHRLGGAGSWGLILAAQAIGAVAGAATMMRYRPARLLLAGTIAILVVALPLGALAIPLSTTVIAVAAFFAGAGMEVFEIGWSVAMAEQIPRELLSRVSAYDALGSNILSPVGTVVAGPLALTLGFTATLLGGAGLVLAATLAVLCVPEVRRLTRIRR
jgi:MFS family permease